MSDAQKFSATQALRNVSDDAILSIAQGHLQKDTSGKASGSFEEMSDAAKKGFVKDVRGILDKLAPEIDEKMKERADAVKAQLPQLIDQAVAKRMLEYPWMNDLPKFKADMERQAGVIAQQAMSAQEAAMMDKLRQTPQETQDRMCANPDLIKNPTIGKFCAGR